MISPFDQDYILTKKVKKEEGELLSPFLELSDWVEKKYDVKILNIIFDICNDRPRIQIILEFESDKNKFHESESINLNLEKMNAISSRFRDIIEKEKIPNFKTEKLFTIFSAFAPLAIEEAHNSISETELEDLRIDLNNNLWKIRCLFGVVTFFYETESQRIESEDDEIDLKYREAYFEIIKKYDEFNYLDSKILKIEYDSKEKFDKDYNGSWFNYDR
ncbi:MAG: hypothetical protein HRT89_01235 [Lentisphaeria bacterium]|nr:hypothetical protein [Lentisphaeria bacterium]NQZ66668.1 hypothetical protein [Lentisphaeria bacterium]